jgi:hypothetical protein
MQSEGLPSTEWQMGKNKIFLRGSVSEPLEDKRLFLINKVYYFFVIHVVHQMPTTNLASTNPDFFPTKMRCFFNANVNKQTNFCK